MSLIETKFGNECRIKMKWRLKEDDVRNVQGHLNSYILSSTIPGLRYKLRLTPNHRNTNVVKVSLICIFLTTMKIKGTFTIFVKSASSQFTVSNEIYDIANVGWGREFCKTAELFNPDKKFFVDGIMEIEMDGVLKPEGGIKRKAPESFSLAKHLWEISSVFQDELKQVGKRAAKKKIILPDFSFEIFNVAVEFMYERDINELVTEEIAAEVLRFADKYKIVPLHEAVQHLLIEKLSETNVCKLANISVTAKAKDLQEFCICFLLKFFGKNIIINDINQLDAKIAAEVGRRSLFSTSA
uniref:BTB domain-containing protein n=1 Tax=Panagrolaimus sp. PS1159 TaxID=55785 RepID=A0AC35F8Q6_9BILA